MVLLASGCLPFGGQDCRRPKWSRHDQVANIATDSSGRFAFSAMSTERNDLSECDETSQEWGTLFVTDLETTPPETAFFSNGLTKYRDAGFGSGEFVASFEVGAGYAAIASSASAPYSEALAGPANTLAALASSNGVLAFILSGPEAQSVGIHGAGGADVLLGLGGQPLGITLMGGFIYATLQGGLASEIDPESGTQVREIPTACEPAGPIGASSGGVLVMSCASGGLAEIDTVTESSAMLTSSGTFTRISGSSSATHVLVSTETETRLYETVTGFVGGPIAGKLVDEAIFSAPDTINVALESGVWRVSAPSAAATLVLGLEDSSDDGNVRIGSAGPGKIVAQTDLVLHLLDSMTGTPLREPIELPETPRPD